MQLHELKRNTPNKNKAIVGRGGKRGKTSGRGHKGQKARAGHCIRPEMRDVIKRIPKRRGYGKNRARSVNSSRVKPIAINVVALEKVIENGEKVTPVLLVERGLTQTLGGKIPKVKVLGTGELTKKITVEKCFVSVVAKEKIEKAGGSVV